MPGLFVVLLAAILIAIGLFLIFNLDRALASSNLWKVGLPALIFVGLGIFLLFGSIPVEVLKRKFWGLVLFLGGFWFSFRFPAVTDYQPEAMGWTGFMIGIVMIVIGIWMVFF